MLRLVSSFVPYFLCTCLQQSGRGGWLMRRNSLLAFACSLAASAVN